MKSVIKISSKWMGEGYNRNCLDFFFSVINHSENFFCDLVVIVVIVFVLVVVLI